MAKNDVVLLDGILEQRVKESFPTNQTDEVFEYFAFEQVLKDYDLSNDELKSGWVDGENDGGIDGFFTLVNGHLLRDPDAFAWPKRNAAIEIWIITGKHHATFQQAPLNALLASLPELMDLSLGKGSFIGHYSDALLNARALFHIAYRKLSAVRPTLSFRFAYTSRGDSKNVGENVSARADQVIALARSLFSSCDAKFEFVGATELVDLHRRTKRFSLDLPYQEYLARESGSYVLLVRLDEYYRFVTDEHQRLRRYLFDSNVRDYLGENRVNEDIAESLRDPDAPDFWWLNNGISILTTAATVLGKTIQLQDVQIVNGLQTTETIYNHFQAGGAVSGARALMVRIVVSTDSKVRDQIIRANNNQSLVELASLHATDRIQRDIEEILERHGWYYERRKNYYRNIGKPQARFVTPMFLAAGYVALVMKNPVSATQLKTRILKDPVCYEAVFPSEAPLAVWPVIADILKRTEEALATFRPARHGQGERFLVRWRNIVAFLATARILGSFSYSTQEFLAIDASAIDQPLVGDIWNLIQGIRPPAYDSKFSYLRMVDQFCQGLTAAHGTKNPEVVGKWKLPPYNRAPKEVNVPAIVRPLNQEMVDKVDAILPPQPWKPGVHRQVSVTLGCSTLDASAAIQQLIASGRRFVQKDGVVYDSKGKVILVDPERTDIRVEGNNV